MSDQFEDEKDKFHIDYNDDIEDQLERAKKPKSSNVEILSAPTLLREEFRPMQWAVKDILPEGCILFAGRPKLGKSWFAYQISLAVATGSYALGEIRVKQGDVLY